MKNIWGKIRRDRFRKMSAPVGVNLLGMRDYFDSLPDGERKVMVEIFNKSVRESFHSVGVKLLERAYGEGLLSKKEYRSFWKRELNLDESEMGTVLSSYFMRVDGHFPENDVIVILTMKDSFIYKAREEIFKKFNVKVESEKEVMERKKRKTLRVIKKL